MEKVRKRFKRPVSTQVEEWKSVKMMPLESERMRPDNYNSLIEYLEKTGKIQLANKAQLLKARNLFVMGGMHPDEVCEKVRVERHVVDRWITMFDWHEKRDMILFRQFRELRDLRETKSKNIDLRHDRIAGTIEGTVEKMLIDHADGDSEFYLAPKDLSSLSQTLKSMQQVRRTIYEKPQAQTQHRQELVIDTGAGMDNMVAMIEGALGGAGAFSLEAPRLKQITVVDEDDNDRGFE